MFASLVYCHRQDVKAYRENGVLFIRFINADGDEEGTHALGDQVRILLEINGLVVEWDGRPDKAIMVLA